MRLTLALVLAFDAGDPWIGRDKLKHFLLSAFVQCVSYSAARGAGADHTSSMIGATVASGAVGLGKELSDRRSGGVFSGKDLVWDAAGIAAASAILSHAER